MKLREILKGCRQVYVAEYDGDDLFTGGLYYESDARPNPVSLDGDSYSLDVEVKSWAWRDRFDLKVII